MATDGCCREESLSEPFEAILFDNDGVLVDTEPLFFRATRESLAIVEVHLSVEDYHDISMRELPAMLGMA